MVNTVHTDWQLHVRYIVHILIGVGHFNGIISVT